MSTISRRSMIASASTSAIAFAVALPAHAEEEERPTCMLLPSPFHNLCIRGDYAVLVLEDQREIFIPLNPNARPRTWGHVVDLRDI